jgi:hypothetical protein
MTHFVDSFPERAVFAFLHSLRVAHTAAVAMQPIEAGLPRTAK